MENDKKKSVSPELPFEEDTSRVGIHDNADNQENYKQVETKIQDELKKKFTPKKKYSDVLGTVYSIMGERSRSDRVFDCGNFLEFKYTEGQKPKLSQAYFCKDRLCPMCNWRRSLKIFGQVSQVMNELQKDDDLAFLFLTTTVRNCTGEELPATVQQIYDGWRYLTNKNKRFKKAVVGTFRTFETTLNQNPFSPWYNTFHPHTHSVLAVRKSYFKSRDYIPIEEWVQLWKHACKLDYDPIVHVQRVYQLVDGQKEIDGIDVSKAVAESAKYAVKGSDYLFPEDVDLSVETTEYLLSALSGRRLCSWTGVFNQARKKLNLDNVEDGDLVHTDNEDVVLRDDLKEVVFRYQWKSGVYLKV